MIHVLRFMSSMSLCATSFVECFPDCSLNFPKPHGINLTSRLFWVRIHCSKQLAWKMWAHLGRGLAGMIGSSLVILKIQLVFGKMWQSWSSRDRQAETPPDAVLKKRLELGKVVGWSKISSQTYLRSTNCIWIGLQE